MSELTVQQEMLLTYHFLFGLPIAAAIYKCVYSMQISYTKGVKGQWSAVETPKFVRSMVNLWKIGSQALDHGHSCDYKAYESNSPLNKFQAFSI